MWNIEGRISEEYPGNSMLYNGNAWELQSESVKLQNDKKGPLYAYIKNNAE